MSRFSTTLALLCLAALVAPLLLQPTEAALGSPLFHEPEHCIGCKDAEWTEGCPKPQLCGYKPILCVDCMDGHGMPKCPHPEWCTDVDCSHAEHRCMNGMAMPDCPDPGTCGFEPLACWGCVPGVRRNGCPAPEHCHHNMTTPPCMDCMDGHAMPYCPNATQCQGEGPMPPQPEEDEIKCINCMPGMWMPDCPEPELCIGKACMMQMLFGAGTDTCMFLESWKVTDGAQWFGASMAILLLAILREFLSVWRVHGHVVRVQEARLRRMQKNLQRAKEAASRAPGGAAAPSGSPSASTNTAPASGDSYMELAPSPTPAVRAREPSGVVAQCAIDAVYYMLSLTLGYLLMLLVMTYNVWICLLVVGFCGLCHFAANALYQVRWRRAYVRDVGARIAECERRGGQLQRSGAGLIIEGGARPVSGDHCCDDLEFDEF